MSVDLLKVTDRRRLANIVQEQLREQPEVRPFPASVTQLIATCQDANATPDTFEKIIQTDASLAARLLRMANSPLYGVSQEVTGIGHAVAVLGSRQLRHLAFSLAGAGMFREGGTDSQQREFLWTHSLGCATVAQLLAKTTIGVDPDDAFLGGVFHDVGKLFLLDVVPESYVELSSAFRGKQLIDEERRIFGVTHEEIGLKSSHAWSLPEALKTGIGFHHRPSEAPCHSEFAAVIATANVLAHYWGVGSTEGHYAEAASEHLAALDISEADQLSLANQARSNFSDAASAMSS